VLNSCDVCQADIEKVVVKAIQQFICESILKKKNQFVKKSIASRERSHLAYRIAPASKTVDNRQFLRRFAPWQAIYLRSGVKHFFS
jgi:hypothetical protein